MLITKIILKDFRQFYGKQEIELVTTGSKKTVVVIYGANGRGKTSLYRALMFCLFGIKRLSQDAEESKEELRLVNKVTLEKAPKDKEIEAFVELEFSHDGNRYTIKRSLIGIKSNNKEYEQMGDVFLSKTDKKGNTFTFNEEDKIEREINTILDKRVREYFLFDGEKMERLTRIAREQKREIEIGIKNLLNIDRLIVASKGINLLLKHLEDQLKSKSTGEYHQLIIKIREKEKERDEQKSTLNSMDRNLKLLGDELKDIDKKLNKFQGISKILKRREETQKYLNDAINERESLLIGMVDNNDDIGLLLIGQELKNIENIIGKKIKSGEIPSPVRERLVNKILKDGICICKTKIKNNPSATKAIMEWKNRIPDERIEDGMLYAHTSIGITREFLKHKIEGIQQDLQAYSSITERIEDYERELKNISDEIGDQKVNEDIPKLEKSRRELIKKQAKYEHQCEDTEKDFKIIEEDIKILQKKLHELEKQQGIKNALARRCDLLRQTTIAIDTIIGEFTSEIKTKISEYASDIFHKLIDEEGSKTFKEIKVANDYSLQLYDWSGKPFLANISAGQRQIMSIAFISSLAKIASSEDVLEMPLFMDTPFGRLSGEHRDNLIKNIPNLTKQWILLATDTEFGKEEAEMLRSTKKWGKIYILKGEKPFITEIKEKSVESFIPKRTSAKERG
ncbi:MAG: AAA family ATPase [Candidatus Omnitrophica bacterium]|nr:AAA family ATPase [Candidatus Omnitrophota bacterium]